MSIPVSVFCTLLDSAIEAGRSNDEASLDAINTRLADVNIRFVVDSGRLYMMDNTKNVAIASDRLDKLRVRVPR